MVTKDEAKEVMKLGKFSFFVETSALADKGTVELVEYTVSACMISVFLNVLL